MAATGGKLCSPHAGAIPISPALLAGKGEAGLVLPQFSVPALPTSPFPIAGIALALAPHPWRGKLPNSSLFRAQASAVLGSTGATRVGDILRKHAEEWFCKNYCYISVLPAQSRKTMSHTSTVPYCVATILLWSNFNHCSDNLQLSKGLPTPRFFSGILEQIRIGSNISHDNQVHCHILYVYKCVKGNIEWTSEQACQKTKPLHVTPR